MPVFDPSTWRLETDGLVRYRLSLSYEELRRLPQAQQVSTFHCVTGWTVKNVRWGDVRFEQLLKLCDPLPPANAIRFVSLEQPYDDSLTLEQATLPDVMLALKVKMSPGLSLDDAVDCINALERRIKAKFPEVAWCFVEPDVTD
jgi:DMSO/TMAO reductase YedYZ molybdopterin-dependent catalytic subunit